MRRLLHIDLDAFFVSVERALEPRLQGQPLVVGGDPDGRGVVACASYEARACGLRAGMPLATARRLCPQAVFLKGSFGRYRQASARFMEILSRFSPDVEPLGLDEAYLDLTGFEPIYGSAQKAALLIKSQVKDELGGTASVGIASSKVVAKVASSLSKPDGLIEVLPGEEQSFLAPLPVAALPCVGAKTERRLNEMGITTIGQLAYLPPSFLKQSFGSVGQVMHNYAKGIDQRKVQPPASVKSISRETTLARDTLDQRLLGATLRYLSERVGAELRAQGRQARSITLKLRYGDFETLSRSRTLREAGDTDQVIFGVGLELLEKALGQRPKLVRLLGIGVSNLVRGGRQLNMLDPSQERQQRLDQAIDRIRSKYGFTAIELGQALALRDIFPIESGYYVLDTPSLSR